MSYKFYLDDLLFPVNPSKLTCKYSNKNKTVELIDGREINILKQPGLSEFSFDVVIPASKYPYANYDGGFLTVDYYLLRLKQMKEENKPIYFKVTRKLGDGKATFDTDDFKCTLEDYQYSEEAKNGFDVTVSITLKGYIDYETDKHYVPVGVAYDSVQYQQEAARATDKEVPSDGNPTTYTVQEGDTTLTVSRRIYGNDTNSRRIIEDNNLSKPNDLRSGQKLRLNGKAVRR